MMRQVRFLIASRYFIADVQVSMPYPLIQYVALISCCRSVLQIGIKAKEE